MSPGKRSPSKLGILLLVEQDFVLSLFSPPLLMFQTIAAQA